MSDFMREEFSEWLLDIHGLESEWQEARNCFKDFPAHLAYQAWQASRECQVIELPAEPECPEDPEEAIDDSHMDAYHSAIRMRNACRDSIHAAGVKTK